MMLSQKFLLTGGKQGRKSITAAKKRRKGKKEGQK